ncbi:MAG: hypothetical protein JNM82_16780 [Rhodocyclaceae bacterium]|nr:hypothetical protein [Rhodocyclaceae bacterium]
MNPGRLGGLAAALALTLAVAGCATAPAGPRVTALPGGSRSFDQFRHDDGQCRRYAEERTSGHGYRNATLKGAAVGTLVGALAGAAIGGRDAAGAGAGLGLIAGSLAGNDSDRHGSRGNQRDYDAAYTQCMYGKGHKVAVAGSVPNGGYRAPPAPVRPPAYTPAAPPPPPGRPPPPPPGAWPR